MTSFSFAQSNSKNHLLIESDKFQGKIYRIENFPTKFITPRKVDVWLPVNYSTTKKYSVLYMHDGQMLFDANSTWNKQEWMVDEVVSRLIAENKIEDLIVVAIWNISNLRHRILQCDLKP